MNSTLYDLLRTEILLGTAAILLLGASYAFSAEQTARDSIPTSELKKYSLEELMSMDISIVSKRSEPISGAAAMVQVVSNEDIRHSAATTLPEALRLAPNLQVAQIDSRQWAITSRGFNNSIANKLLVLIDGRTVYTPLFSGVFWDAQDVFLPDLDRIEVISGPGASLWGANAVNGVINVITRSARDPESRGLLMQAGAGTGVRGLGRIRYGGQATDELSYRVYAQHDNHDDSHLPDGTEADDAWLLTQGGFRIDCVPSDDRSWTLQGDAYTGTFNQPDTTRSLNRAVINTDNTSISGGNLLGRWNGRISGSSNLEIQAYYDYTNRVVPGTFGETRNSLNLQVQNRLSSVEHHDIFFGAAARVSGERVTNSEVLAFLPPDLTTKLFTWFIQDEISVQDRVHVTIGTQFEHNDFSGYEVQPSIRLTFKPAEDKTLWAAVSRAVRTPSRIDRDFFVPGGPPYFLAGGPDFTSEKLMSFDLGYRFRLMDDLYVDAAAFYHRYDDLRSLEPSAPATIANGLEGDAGGGTVVANYQVTGWWRLKCGYTRLEKSIRLKPGSADVNGGEGEGNDPRHQVMLNSSMHLPGDIDLELLGRTVSALTNASARVPAYFAFDAGIHWHPDPALTFSLLGQDLPMGQHPEFGTAPTAGSPLILKEIQRSIYGTITWRP